MMAESPDPEVVLKGDASEVGQRDVAISGADDITVIDTETNYQGRHDRSMSTGDVISQNEIGETQPLHRGNAITTSRRKMSLEESPVHGHHRSRNAHSMTRLAEGLYDNDIANTANSQRWSPITDRRRGRSQEHVQHSTAQFRPDRQTHNVDRNYVHRGSSAPPTIGDTYNRHVASTQLPFQPRISSSYIEQNPIRDSQRHTLPQAHSYGRNEYPYLNPEILDPMRQYIIANDNRARRRPSLNPEPFDGSTDWDGYISHFESIARLGHWTEEDKFLALAASVRGPARTYYLGLPLSERESYSRLVHHFYERFGSLRHQSRWLGKLETRKRQSGESIAALGDDIRLIAQKAYPHLETRAQEALALNQLFKVVPFEMKTRCIDKDCNTVAEAVDVIERYESLLDEERDRRKAPVRFVRGESEKKNEHSKEMFSDAQSAGTIEPYGNTYRGKSIQM